MAEETKIGINITATDNAGAAIRVLQQQLKALQSEIARTTASGIDSAGGYRAVLQKNIDKINEQIAALRAAGSATAASAAEQVAAINTVTAAIERQRRATTITAAESGLLFGIQPRRLVSAFDELARGQRGALIATTGAAIKDMGLSASGMLAPFGALVALMGSVAILRGAENMGRWAQEAKAAASATGMSINQYTALAGAFELMGLKGDQADYALRQFAEHLGQAVADPTSKAAQAFHALGISQSEIRANASDTEGMLMRTANAWAQYANTATKSEAGTALFGRSLERIAPALEHGSAGLASMENKARDLGLTLTDETTNSLTDTNRKIEDLVQAVRGEAIQAFIAWGPAIQTVVELLGGLGKVISGIVTGVGELASAIPKAMQGAVGSIQQGLSHAEQLRLAREGKLYDGAPGAPPTGGYWAQVGARPVWRPGAAAAPPYVPSAEGELVGGVTGVKPIVPPMDEALQRKAAKQSYEEFAAAEREKIAEAAGDSAQIQAIYEQWLARAKAQFGESSTQFRTVQREMVRAAQEASSQIIEAMEKAAQAMSRANQDQLRGFESQMEAMVRTKRLTPQQAYGFDIEEAVNLANEQKARLDAIMSSPIATQTQKEQAYWQEWDLGTQLQAQLDSLHEKIVAAGQADAQSYMRPWISAFDEAGSQIESTISQAIKSAFIPMRPEYWISSLQGPHGQPLFQYHRISPEMQLLGSLGTSMLGDFTKALTTSIEQAFAKSVFGAGTTSISQGLVTKLFGWLGIGGVGGAGTQAAQMAATSANTTAITALTTAVLANTAAVTTSAAASGGKAAVSAVSSAGSIGGFFSSIGALFSFEHGGIVSAQGGMRVGGVPALASLHPREMVLPGHLSEGLQDMIEGGRAGDMHLHIHSMVTDAPSLDRWFRGLMTKNSSVLKNVFKYHGMSLDRMTTSTP